jgi:hypothetical protein
MKVIVALVSLAVVAGCVISPKQEIRDAVPDGSSHERAFVIRARSQDAGRAEEYAILKEKFPGARQAEVERVDQEMVVFGHRTETRGDRVFSVHTLVLREGVIRSVHFDITNYFGK